MKFQEKDTKRSDTYISTYNMYHIFISKGKHLYWNKFCWREKLPNHHEAPHYVVVSILL